MDPEQPHVAAQYCYISHAPEICWSIRIISQFTYSDITEWQEAEP